MGPHANESKQAAEVAYRMANILSYRGWTDRAIDLYRRAIALEPSYVPAYLEVETLLRALGRIDECIGLYRRAAEAIPDERIFAIRLRELLAAATRSEGAKAERPVQWTGSAPNGQETRAHVVIYADCSGISGAEQMNHIIAMGLRAGGYRVTFVQPQASHHLIQERSARGITHVWIEEDDIYRGGAASPSLCRPTEGQAVFRQLGPDLVLFCDGCPVSSLGAKQAARDLGIPYIALVHCVTRDWAILFSKHLTRLGALYRFARQVIAVSHENLALLRDCFGLPTEQGTVIYHGVAAAFFENRDRHIRSVTRRELGIPDDAIVCLTVGRMEPVKGYQFLVKAIREVRKGPVGARLHCVWIGSGSMEPRIRAMIDRIGAVREIHLIGSTSRVQHYLDAADMFVLPSMFEGMPVSVMEAMAKGLPVAATAVSGIAEELGDTGFLLPDPTPDSARTVAGLIDVLERWALDEDHRHEIGAECRRRAERMFTRERMVAEYLRLVERVLDDRSKPLSAGYVSKEAQP